MRNNCQKINSKTESEEFFNATYGLNTLLTNKKSKNDFLNKR